MPNWKYLTGLIIISSVVWLTMIVCLAIVYLLLPPLEQLTVGKLVTDAIQLVVAASIVLVWLYSWNVLVRFYFRRNLRVVTSRNPMPQRRRKEYEKS